MPKARRSILDPPAEKGGAGDIFSMVLRSKSAMCLICCCCLVFLLNFAAIGLFMFRDRLFGSGMYYFQQPQHAPHPGGRARARGSSSPPVRQTAPGSGSATAGGGGHHAAPTGGPGGIPRAFPTDPRLRAFVLEDFGAAADAPGEPQQLCGPLLLGVGAHHDYECHTAGGRCLCQSASHTGVWAVPTTSIIGAQKGGSTALLGYLMQVPGYRNAIAKELHFFDRTESMMQRGVPGFFEAFDPADPATFAHEQVGWTTPSLLYALDSPKNVKKMMPGLKMVVVLRNPIDRAMSEYYMEYRRIETQNKYLEQLLPLMPGILQCHAKEAPRLRRQGGASHGQGGPPSPCIDLQLPLFRDDGFHTFLLNGLLNQGRLMDATAECLSSAGVTALGAADLKIGTPGYAAGKRCFAEHGHIYIEEVSSIEDDFEKEMGRLEECSSVNADGVKLLEVGTRRCFKRGATSNLMEGNFLMRSIYSAQIRNWFAEYDPAQFLFVSSDKLHEDPQAVVNEVTQFLGLPRHQLDTSIDMHDFINKQFPGFEEATGWSIAAKYPPLKADLRSRLASFFQPFMDDTSLLIGWDSINWK